ncbi:DUF7019 family protein [Amycolatopsis anabasis]|uniref:DUF7019 family protein n=1 Tax=Amycolatopsis anabasis TaxID=1840409 RepID=UPI0024834663|nr:SAVMC3_10250 family protein [Amycolatopsis anabasis]
MFRRQRPPLRYFVYVSDIKLDMLFEQIDPAQRRRIAAEAKVDLKLASLTLRRAEPSPAARMAKLRVVERYIDAHHLVGTTAAPGRQYFRGRLDMQWGFLARNQDAQPEDRLPVVFFRGWQGRDFVALAGSRSHVLGQYPADDRANAEFGFSSAPSIVAVLRAHISDLEGTPQYPAWGERDERTLQTGTPLEEEYRWHLSNAASIFRLDAPSQPLEFLAVPLGESPQVSHPGGGHGHGVLGTPIYIAHAY